MNSSHLAIFVEGIVWFLGIIALIWIVDLIFSDADKNFDDGEER